jgi:xylulokinase
MSLLGIDVGTTGCKAAAVRDDGTFIASAYAEYPIQGRQPGWAELDAESVWQTVQETIARVAGECGADRIQALSVSSLGEAVVPVSADRRILAPSILNFDVRGEEYLPRLSVALGPEQLYRISGHALANTLGLPKLLWLQEHEPQLWGQAYRFLPWSSFVSFMLGAEPVVDYSLAGRLLCLDVDGQRWSAEILDRAGLDASKLPTTAPAGTPVGTVSDELAAKLGIDKGVAVVSGCHDQCAVAVGCGAVEEGLAACGLGTFVCMTPVFRERRDPSVMLRGGLNTEYHPAPGRFVTLIYNLGGGLLRWYRDTFAAAEHQQAKREGRDVYDALMAELPPEPSEVLVLPHFVATGPPEFITDSSGVAVGLHLSTKRGSILKGILEGVMFHMRECLDGLPETGIEVSEFRAAGGGSRSDAWLQICADIIGRPFMRAEQIEAGVLGAAMIAGVGCGAFASFEDAVAAMVRYGRTFEPDAQQQRRYQVRYEQYRKLWPLMRDYLRELSSTTL